MIIYHNYCISIAHYYIFFAPYLLVLGLFSRDQSIKLFLQLTYYQSKSKIVERTIAEEVTSNATYLLYGLNTFGKVAITQLDIKYKNRRLRKIIQIAPENKTQNKVKDWRKISLLATFGRSYFKQDRWKRRQYLRQEYLRQKFLVSI